MKAPRGLPDMDRDFEGRTYSASIAGAYARAGASRALRVDAAR
jgi:hypothetical protein